MLNFWSRLTLIGMIVGAGWLLTACQKDTTPEEMTEEEMMEEMEEETNDDSNVTMIESFAIGDSVTVSGDIANGEQLSDLDWAANSNVACFPGTRAIEFEGNQVFYSVTIPQGGELIATVTPTGERERINLYAYIDFDGENTPPVQSVVSCEAGYEIYTGTPDLTKPGEPQAVSFAQAVNRSYTAFIAVSGARDVLSGTYDLTLRLDPM